MISLERRLPSILRLLAGSLLGASALLGCSAAGGNAAGSAGAGPGAGSSSGGAGSGSGIAGAGGSAGSTSGDGLGGSAGKGLILDLDAAVSDDDASAGCTHLNIGILGNPGSNNASNFEQWLTKSGTSVKRIQTTADEPMTRATLQPFDVVVIDCLTRDYTTDEASAFSAWVSAGGGVAAMSGYHDDTTIDWHANSLLAPLGVAYSGGLMWGPVTSFATHPITTGLTSVTFTGGYAISDLGGTASTRTPIAFLPSMPAATAGFAVQMAAGRAFVWGDEWIEFDSEWSTQPEIPQLWVQVFGWIAPMTKCSLTPPK
jgi:hypothetical protein